MDVDEFGDDDLGELPDNTLYALEQHAISATQKPQGSSANHRSDLAWQPSQLQKLARADAPPLSAPDQPSSDYGFEDEDVINLDEPSMVIQPASGLPQPDRHPSKPLPHRKNKVPLDPDTEAAYAAADAELSSHGPGQWAAAPHLAAPINNDADLDTLHARIARLEAEQAALRKSEEQAREALSLKQGEISIVRANQEKVTREYERRISVMQKLHADETAKQKTELDAGKKERDKIETDNRFLQHDLRQEAERSRRMIAPGKAKSLVGQGAGTPRKSKRTALGDGFDDEEVMRVSPSKSKDQSADHTPKTGAKRKRAAQDSPIPVLSFSQPSGLIPAEDSHDSPSHVRSADGVVASVLNDDLGFMQRLIHHRLERKKGRVMEILADYAFPLAPADSISSILMRAISSQVPAHEKTHLPLKTCRGVLNIWRRCLTEQYYGPIYLLLDLLRFSLRLEPSSTTSALIEEGVLLCVHSVDLIAVPVARASTNPGFAATMDKGAHEKLKTQINVDEILDFLKLLCDSAALSDDRISLFWQRMSYTFTLLMLNKAQPVAQITTVLQMLASSAAPTTFGPITPTAKEQAVRERDMINRLMNLLEETPEVPPNEDVYSEEEITELRIAVLQVLKAMCVTGHGGLRLAQHPIAIGRMIRFLDLQLSALYNARPSIGLSFDDEDFAMSQSQPPLHDLIAETINTTTILLYHILKTYSTVITFSAKTAAVKGSYHHFIVAMTRIAFSDQLVLEAGISDQAVEAAHSILDDVLNPEEGEAVMKAVETPRGTRSTGFQRGDTTEKATDSGGEDVAMLDAG